MSISSLRLRRTGLALGWLLGIALGCSVGHAQAQIHCPVVGALNTLDDPGAARMLVAAEIQHQLGNGPDGVDLPNPARVDVVQTSQDARDLGSTRTPTGVAAFYVSNRIQNTVSQYRWDFDHHSLDPILNPAALQNPLVAARSMVATGPDPGRFSGDGRFGYVPDSKGYTVYRIDSVSGALLDPVHVDLNFGVEQIRVGPGLHHALVSSRAADARALYWVPVSEHDGKLDWTQLQAIPIGDMRLTAVDLDPANRSVSVGLLRGDDGFLLRYALEQNGQLKRIQSQSLPGRTVRLLAHDSRHKRIYVATWHDPTHDAQLNDNDVFGLGHLPPLPPHEVLRYTFDQPDGKLVLLPALPPLQAQAWKLDNQAVALATIDSTLYIAENGSDQLILMDAAGVSVDHIVPGAGSSSTLGGLLRHPDALSIAA